MQASNGKAEPRLRYERRPDNDLRIARGDDFAGDAWFDTKLGTLRYVAVGVNPNLPPTPRAWLAGLRREAETARTFITQLLDNEADAATDLLTNYGEDVEYGLRQALQDAVTLTAADPNAGAELARLRQDAARLEWLNHRMGEADASTWSGLGLIPTSVDLRSAIDRAMQDG